MANQEHLYIIKKGAKAWNEWVGNQPHTEIDLKGANLRGANLIMVNLSKADLTGADLKGADLTGANLSEANLHNADLREVDLSKAGLIEAKFREANLRKAVLRGADLTSADFTRADLTGADFRTANLVGTNFTGANLNEAFLAFVNLTFANLREANLTFANINASVLVGTCIEQANFRACRIYGIAAWDLEGTPRDQSGLIITDANESVITVDDLQVAQFVYMLLNNKNVRNVIDTITSKAVLILGRFTAERKAVLEAISTELRKRNYLPIVLDFTGPQNRNITETVSTLAHMAKFVVADITDASSIPQELMAIVPHLPSVPVQPLILSSQNEYGMFKDFRNFRSVLKIYHYDDADSLIKSIEEKVIQPAENWLNASGMA